MCFDPSQTNVTDGTHLDAYKNAYSSLIGTPNSAFSHEWVDLGNSGLGFSYANVNGEGDSPTASV